MSTYSNNLRIELITSGTQAGTWGDTTNTNLGTIVEDSIAGYTTVSVIAANQAFTAIDGAADQARNAMIRVTTTTGANFAVYAPPYSKQYVIFNDSSFIATIYNSTVQGNTTAAGLGVAIPAGKTMTVWSNGTDFLVQNSHIIGTVVGNVTGNVTGQLDGTISAATTAVTQPTETNNTTVATTAFVKNSGGLPDSGANGLVVRTAVNTTTARSIAAGTGISVANGDGVSANPTITNTGVTSLAAGTGISVSAGTGGVTVSSTVTPGFSNIAVFTSSGSWTVPAGITACKVTVIGGGGGGGVSWEPSAAGGGGGAGGGTAIKFVSGLTPGGVVGVTVGAGGAGGVAISGVYGTGGTGGTSSFGGYCSATGGAGSTSSSTAVLGGFGSGGDLNFAGGPGQITTSYTGAAGGNSFMGAGAPSISGGSPSAGRAYGGGGSGWNSTIGVPGGAGAAGVVVVEY